MTVDNFEKLYQDGLKAYHEQEYYDAHELWEDLWHNKSIADRKFIQGLIQLSASLYKAQCNSSRGARSLLDKAQEKFAMFDKTVYQLDVGVLREECGILMNEYLKSEDLSRFDFSFAPNLKAAVPVREKMT